MATTATPIEQRPHSVYEIYSTVSGRCIYVGMTCDLARRLQEHASLRQWRLPAFRVASTTVPNRAAAHALEAERIQELRPTQNRQGNGRAAA